MTVAYHYPFEVVQHVETGRHYLKQSLAPDGREHYTCKGCGRRWPADCGCILSPVEREAAWQAVLAERYPHVRAEGNSMKRAMAAGDFSVSRWRDRRTTHDE